MLKHPRRMLQEAMKRKKRMEKTREPLAPGSPGGRPEVVKSSSYGSMDELVIRFRFRFVLLGFSDQAILNFLKSILPLATSNTSEEF